MEANLESEQSDYRQRFILPEIGVWGACVRLTSSWTEILSHYDYDTVVTSKLGEAVVATVLLTTHLKREGSLILQTQSEGPLHTLVAQSTREGTVRGLARAAGQVNDGDVTQVFGEGKLMMTIDNENQERYQGIVALDGKNLGEALETYFSQSEQLETRLWLEADKNGASGLLLQRLPTEENRFDENDKDEALEHWRRVTLVADTLRPRELLDLSSEEVIHRLFHQEKVRRFVPEGLRFYCGCSTARIEAMLIAMGREEVDNIVEEHGAVEVDCEFCNKHYRLEKGDCQRLFDVGKQDADTDSHTGSKLH